MQQVSGRLSPSVLQTFCERRRELPKTFLSLLSAGPVSSILVNRYGSRPVVMVGGVMVCTGMVLASFGNSIVHLYLCVGVIGGKYFVVSLLIMSAKLVFI